LIVQITYLDVSLLRATILHIVDERRPQAGGNGGPGLARWYSLVDVLDGTGILEERYSFYGSLSG
jgi:hypothetical protein